MNTIDNVAFPTAAAEEKAAKKAAKRAKKLAKAERKAAQAAMVKPSKPELIQVAAHAQAGTPAPEAPKPEGWKVFTKADNAEFAARIKNEKRIIWRECNAQAEAILVACSLSNQEKERNAAKRLAMKDAYGWAQDELAPAAAAPF